MKAAPAHFPYAHRTMAEVMANEATDCDQIRDALVAFIAASSMKNDGPESALTLNPGLPINAYKEREG